QHQDRYRNAGPAQRDALLHEGDPELVHALRLQVAGDTHQPVAVGIGLDDAHHRHADAAADRAQVARERVEVDDDPGGALDGGIVHGAIRAHPAGTASAAGARRRYSKLPTVSCARLSKRVYSPKNFSLKLPVGPFRCLPMMISARPLSGEFSLL